MDVEEPVVTEALLVPVFKVLVVVSITLSLLSWKLDTYIFVPDIDIPDGEDPTSKVLITVLLVVSIIDTVPSSKFSTYNVEPKPVIPRGPLPTDIVAMIVLLVVSITETLSER